MADNRGTGVNGGEPVAPRRGNGLRRGWWRRRRGESRLPLREVVMQVTGYLFLVLGVLGLFLPILQGFLFLAIGLLILSRTSPRIRLLVQRLRARYPRFGRQYDRAGARLQAWQQQVGGWFRRRRCGEAR